jgi:hypothetical protein
MKLLTPANGSLASSNSAPEEFGVGKRKCKANVLYKPDAFWHHKDEDNSDDELFE